MPCANANRNERLLYVLCLGNPSSNLYSLTIRLNTPVNCKKLLGEKFLEDMFCTEHMPGSKERCQVTFLTSFASTLVSCFFVPFVFVSLLSVILRWGSGM